MSAYDLALHIALYGVDQVDHGFDSAAKSADDLNHSLDRVGKSNGMDNLIGQVKRLDAALGAVKDNARQFDNVFESLDKARQVGFGMSAAGAGLLAAAGHALGESGKMELQLTTIEAVTKSPERAGEVFNYDDERSTKSVFSLDELVAGSKALESAGLKTEKYLTAADNLAAVNKDDGATVYDTSRAMTRIKAGDFGEGFERLRDFGVNRGDLEEQGLKFSKSGEYEDKTPEGIEKALDAVVAVVEKKFDGLSEKLATGTLDGAVSNFGDAAGRFERVMGDQLLPMATDVVRFATDVAGAAVEFAKANPGLSKFAAIAVVVVGGILLIGGGLVMLMGTLAGAALNCYAFATARVAATGSDAASTALDTAAKGTHAGASAVDAGATATDAAAVGTHTAAVTTNAAATVSAASVIMGAAASAALSLGIVAAALVLVGLVANKYYQELQKPTETITDARTGDQVAADETNAQAVKDAVTQAEGDAGVGIRDRMKIYAEASKKLTDLGDNEGAEEMIAKRDQLKKTATGRRALDENKTDDDNMSDSAATAEYVKRINERQTNVGALRAENEQHKANSQSKGPEGMDAEIEALKQDAKQQQADAKAARDDIKAEGGGDGTLRTGSRVEGAPGNRRRLVIDPVDLGESDMDRAGRQYTATRPA